MKKWSKKEEGSKNRRRTNKQESTARVHDAAINHAHTHARTHSVLPTLWSSNNCTPCGTVLKWDTCCRHRGSENNTLLHSLEWDTCRKQQPPPPRPPPQQQPPQQPPPPQHPRLTGRTPARPLVFRWRARGRGRCQARQLPRIARTARALRPAQAKRWCVSHQGYP